MFRILIVEDTTEKLKNILLTLKEVANLDIESIDHELSSFGAKKKLKSDFYDLLILDVAIPMRREETIDLEGGLKLLDEILHRDIYKVPSHIIGLTAKEEVLHKAAEKFEASILSVIHYSETDLEWQQKLLKGVEQRVMAKASLFRAEQPYNYDIAIITAVDREFAAVKALSKNWKQIDYPGDSSQYFETIFEENNKRLRVVAACATQMGMSANAVLTMKLIYNFRPRYIFMTGIMASVKKSDTHGYGDIIVIDECWDGGAGKLSENKDGTPLFLPVANHVRLNVDISQKMRSLKDNSDILRKIKDSWKPADAPNTELSIHIGSAVSVAGVVENKAVVSELIGKDRKLLGLEMEAYGMYFSSYNCGNPKPIAVAMKAVSDFANEDKNDIYQSYASYTSAQAMYFYILNYID
ncbi:hypothetical protein [Mucilaginibacter sp. FT3.2]|uniref:phosphorylase family protein n=1 Tax=Mucilaginibacter sp. FT3.2 TaxID=2723090 RepID=UPI001615B14C|nr:hypothetical protein [Mucilaginibacter sp. FT3.2]MBB6231900.1 nucleoside phosphorylase [Mucilaginibacter sp. FT3.2]